ncbi:MAG: polyprenol monophosphomannose synthase [Candidatus Omnitrophota bacterium]|jgi:dolichol-phosphate mannosyltransferase
MKTVIVIPTYNEKDNISPLSERIFSLLPQAHILFVDDNSPDATGAVADKLAGNNPRIKVLHRQRKSGLGKAYIAGFQEALRLNADYIIQMDADFSHDPRYLPEFISEIAQADIVIGTRYHRSKRNPSHITFLSYCANAYTRFVLNLPLSDSLGGFKCFKRKLLEEIRLDTFISSGFVFQAEFMYRAYKAGFKIKEIPIDFYQRRSGETKKTANIIAEAFFKVPLIRWPAVYSSIIAAQQRLSRYIFRKTNAI